MSEPAPPAHQRDDAAAAPGFERNRPAVPGSGGKGADDRFTPIYRHPDGRFVPLRSKYGENEDSVQPDQDREDAHPAQGLEEKLVDLEQEAYERGFQQGREDGYNQERGRMESALDRLHKITRELSQMKKVVLEEAEEQMVELVLAIGRKAIMEEISANRSLVLSAVSAAIEMVAMDGDIQVRVNPDDLAILEENEPRLLSINGEEGRLLFVKDEGVPPGGCVVETDRQLLELDPRQRMQEICEALWKRGAEK